MNYFIMQGQIMVIAVSLLWLMGCDNPAISGPEQVRWDQEPCTRCVMSISEPNFAAQIRGGPAGGPQQLNKFDDLGCAIIWLDQQAWKDNPRVEIWVGEHQTGEWIDAQQAYYVKNQLSPMNYGLGAQREAAPGAIDFAAAREYIYKIEQDINLHGGKKHTHRPIEQDMNFHGGKKHTHRPNEQDMNLHGGKKHIHKTK